MGRLSRSELFVSSIRGWCLCPSSIVSPALGPSFCYCPYDSDGGLIPCSPLCACPRTVPACSYPVPQGWHRACPEESPGHYLTIFSGTWIGPRYQSKNSTRAQIYCQFCCVVIFVWMLPPCIICGCCSWSSLFHIN